MISFSILYLIVHVEGLKSKNISNFLSPTESTASEMPRQ